MPLQDAPQDIMQQEISQITRLGKPDLVDRSAASATELGSDEAGSSVANAWLKVKRKDPTSTLKPLDHCPKCEQPLAPPLQTTGRQVCAKCGWSDKPRISNPQAQADLDLKKLLAQAASESLENMKPRKKRD